MHREEMMRPLRVYIDTSVLGAVFDDEFKETTTAFFDQAREGKFVILLSALVEDEIYNAPEEVQRFFDSVLEYAEIITPSHQALLLQKAYLDAGVVTEKWAGDAMHVATASVEECDVIVSWNFRHIVHYDKKRKYNALNILHGYDSIDILTPAEVIEYEEES
jgi:predicted nucleic acid-binding protein